jgi:hypothetical protein
MSLVWVSPNVPKRRYTFLRKQMLVFLGEIPNMTGWCAVAGCKTGRIYGPHETKIFVELTMKKAKQ